MDIIKIGFVPAHRQSLSEDWAAQLRKRCLDVFSKIPGLEIVVPGHEVGAGEQTCRTGEGRGLRRMGGKR